MTLPMGEGTGGTPATSRDRNVAGRRVAAFFLDTVVVLVLLALVLGPLLLLAEAVQPEGPESAAGALLTLLFVLALFALLFGVYSAYFVLFEVYRGQTPGKMLLGIEVIQERDGRRPGLGAALLRVLLLWAADGQVSGLVGLGAILLTEKKQRLGDMVARTLVVRKR